MYVPEGYGTVFPYIFASDAAGYLTFLERAFGAEVVGRTDAPDGTVANARVYTSLRNEDVILFAELEGGALLSFNDRSRITDRFVLGGDSFRGFARGGLGPRDMCTGCGTAGGDVDDALGGNLYTVARLEASFPIGLPEEYGITGGVFADAGSVWGLDDTAGTGGTVDDSFHLRSSVGLSLFWQTPIGPLRFNWAHALQKEDYDQTRTFNLTLSTRF